jgi:O-antigen/teichoic acid export membrane protein
MGTVSVSEDRNSALPRTPLEQPQPPRSLMSSLLTGMGALGLSLGCERGASFVANVLAARLAGAASFGAYSLALTTANNVATYAGAGIGTTANRFVGQFPEGTAGYRKLLRALALIATVSATIAAAFLWAGAAPLARGLLHNSSLAGPLKVAALSAAGMILLECCRGLLIGQRSHRLMVALSGMVGAGLLLAIPATARFGASAMLAGQACAVTAAVAVCAFLIFRSLGPHVFAAADTEAGPSVWRVWRFGLVQLGEIVGLNAAGWWVAALVARSDASLQQMAFFAIANQLRNVSTLVPSLVGQTSFAMLTEESGASFGGSDRVFAVSSMIASLLATICAGSALAILPLVFRYLYGSAYQGAGLASALAIIIVVIHMGTAPAASRITILSLRVSGIINLFWAALVFALGSGFVSRGGAAAAAASFLAAHVVSMLLVLFWLRTRGALPAAVVAVSGVNFGIASIFLGLTWLRHSNTIAVAPTSILYIAITAAGAAAVWQTGRIFHCFPRTLRWSDVRMLATRAAARGRGQQ